MQENIQLAVSILTLLGILFAIYKYFSDPDIEIKNEVDVIKTKCELRHQYIDENLILIKDNHLVHLEKDVAELKIEIREIKTILKERFKI